MWLWHVPYFYDAALAHPGVHVLEHLSFAAAGLLYWWHLLSPIRTPPAPRRHGPGALHGARRSSLVGLLGILLAFAPER